MSQPKSVTLTKAEYFTVNEISKYTYINTSKTKAGTMYTFTVYGRHADTINNILEAAGL